MLEVLTLRALLRIKMAPVPLQPRMLVDDVSIQYVGSDRSGIRLAKAVQIFQQDSVDLGSRVNLKKSGIVAAARASRAEALRLRGRIPVQSWMCNLGHETTGVRPSRKQERTRAMQLLKRKHRLLMFKGVAGRRSSVLWRSGAQPSVGHGSGVSGTSDEALKVMRSVAALVVGAPARASNTPYLYCQWQMRYDPVFDASTSILCRLHCFIWGRSSPPQ